MSFSKTLFLTLPNAVDQGVHSRLVARGGRRKVQRVRFDGKPTFENALSRFGKELKASGWTEEWVRDNFRELKWNCHATE